MKPIAFIGSSGLKYEIVEAIAKRLEDEVEAHKWKDVFPVGRTTIATLVEEAGLVDFGIFVFGSDDQIGPDVSIPRDNVIYEAGLFAGALGADRSLIVHDRKAKKPTDLKGMTVAKFNASDSAAKIADVVCPALLKAIQKGGPRRFRTVIGSLEGDWWQFSFAPDGGIERARVSFLRFRRSASGYLGFTGDAWRSDGERLGRFESDLSIVDEAEREFEYSWKGRWYVRRSEIDADPKGFYGRGDIVLSRNNRDRASGEYTTHNDSNPDLEDQTPVEFRRADPKDIAIIDGNALSARRALIRKRLAERLAER